MHGIAAGLHATVRLPDDHVEHAILDEAHRRRIDLTTMGDFRARPGAGPPTLLLGYGQIAEHAVPTAARELAAAVHAAGRAGGR